MATEPASAEQTLQRYLLVEHKYEAGPVPAPIDRAAVVKILQDEVKPGQSVDKMEKLARLAIFYHVEESSEQFLSLFQKRETSPKDVARTAHALRALAWIGNDQQWSQAQRYYHGLLGWIRTQGNLKSMEMACNAFGPKEGTEKLAKWVQEHIDKLQEQLDAVKAQDESDPRARSLKKEVDALKRFHSNRIRRIKEANETRTKIEETTDAGRRAAKLAELYVDTTVTSTDELSFWAAMTLVRWGRQGPHARKNIVKAFQDLAAKYDRKEPLSRQAEFALHRATCLRAVLFFGGELTPEEDEWLEKHEDHGHDILVLRPDWEYPNLPDMEDEDPNDEEALADDDDDENDDEEPGSGEVDLDES